MVGKVWFGSWLSLPLLLRGTHTVLGILGLEASRVLGAEQIKLPRWPVSKFRKAFKVPVAFLPFRGVGECTRIENTKLSYNTTHSSKTFLWYLLYGMV